MNDSKNYNPVEQAYLLLVKIRDDESMTVDDALIAIDEAIGYLGEALE